jgi:DNA (cytosine-5)-methyltransferase 1
MGGVPAKISPGLVQCGLNRWPARPGEQQHDWEPPRLATGVKQRVAKLRALGNAVVPLQALPVFTAIMQAEQEGGR